MSVFIIQLAACIGIFFGLKLISTSFTSGWIGGIAALTCSQLIEKALS